MITAMAMALKISCVTVMLTSLAKTLRELTALWVTMQGIRLPVFRNKMTNRKPMAVA